VSALRQNADKSWNVTVKDLKAGTESTTHARFVSDDTIVLAVEDDPANRRHGSAAAAATHRREERLSASRTFDAVDPRRGRAGARHAAAARSVTIRLMLNAALAKTKSASTVARPRSFTLRRPPIVLSHANARSIRGRAC